MPLGKAAPGEIEVLNGKVFWRRSGANQPELVAEGLDARLDWAKADAPLSLVGQCLLPSLGDDRSPARFALWAAQPGRLARGEESPVTLRIDDAAFKVDLDGALALSPRPHFHGQIASAAPSLRAAAGWLGVTLPLPGRYANASVKGEASLNSSLLSFPTVNVVIDGNAMDGAASIRLDGPRPQIAATLAGASVNLAPLFEDMPAPAPGGQWSHEIFQPAQLSAADLDLRLSVSHARLGDFQADDAALSAILKNGRLDLSLAEASAYSGQVRARAIIADTGSGLDIRGSASAEKLDIAVALWDAFKQQTMTGLAHGNVSFETSGDSFAELAARLDARGDVSVENGEVYGLDLDLAFRRMERRPLTAGADMRTGRTGFELLATKFNIVQGAADIEEGVARDARLTTYFSGHAQIAERTVDIHASASRQTVGDGAPLQLGFSLSGGWDDAALAPDALGLINRSDAAAPLLPRATGNN